MTGNDVVKRAREYILMDIDPDNPNVDTNLRIKDAEAIDWINDGIQFIVRRRPDSLSETTISSTIPDDITVLTTTLGVGDRFRGGLADYLAYRFFTKDEQDAQSAKRAQTHLQRAEREIA